MKDKTIALIAHDRRKSDMIEWVKHNSNLLYMNNIVCTGTTGSLVEVVINNYSDINNLERKLITKMNSGPMGVMLK